MRDFRKLKVIDDYKILDAPIPLRGVPSPHMPATSTMMVLRMLVKAKYSSDFYIPSSLEWLRSTIMRLATIDAALTGINSEHSWCYVTVRRGIVSSVTDDEWHFDGSSFRVEIIPERNYIWTDIMPTEFKLGDLSIPADFDPNRHNLFSLAAKQLEGAATRTCDARLWYLLSPFVLHRRPPLTRSFHRTFIRICFTDIEGRDINNTANPLLVTDAYGRDPVRSFRNKLGNYYEEKR